ncbi:GON domain-containing protein [Corallococcus aberystwythensis]|uniref:GON domain-containing protein n=1 Tax=Corallococcus aberystwythensis TaxID=2316722 RepID=A0A3A8Q5B5_9BACT|nr:GON domain-containing protein [Corallococcus aberystwythensis]RKH63897.1 hypothetical protein D7W81_19540 [Corallococcus aberystwythensis]
MKPVKPTVVSPVVPFFPLRQGWRALALSVAAFATGCGAGDAPMPSETSARAQALDALPASCLDIKTAWPDAPDGDYTLYVSGEASAPWTVYCHGMAGTPAEYLTLTRTQAGANSSQYLAGGASPGTTVRTAFTRLRINPATLKVNTADQTFATSTGSLRHSNSQVLVTSMSYGVAMSCNRTLSQGNIDLRGTPFAVPTGQLVPWGGSMAGTGAVSSEGEQVVSLSGGGSCGFVGLAGIVNPYNQGGGLLQLQYRQGDRPSSCQDIKTAHPEATDGAFTLFVNKDPARPWGAWCRDMAGTPAEYLTLSRTGDNVNYSQYTAGGGSPGTNVRTIFTRLRIDPLTLRVDTADQTYSWSSGSILHGNTSPVTSMPYAAAMTCSAVGLGNIDLRGTPFAVPVNQLGRGGYNFEPSSILFSNNNQVVDLRATGQCGWIAPMGSYNPVNQNGLSLLLTWSVPQ